jgi:NitT/TauT family transport system substrate-binding protein
MPSNPPRPCRTVATAALVVACLVAAIACGGGGGGSGGQGESAKPVTLKVGVIPIVDVAPLYLGREKGFFRTEQLTIQPQPAEGGAAIVPSVVSGDDQIGFSNATSLIIAASRDLPVQIIAQGVTGGAKPTAKQAYDAVLVKRNSPIRSPQDLEGKTVAVNTLQNVGPLTINNALQRSGADPKAVKYVEVPFPDMNAALATGRIDAAWMVEPFVTQGRSQGARPILFPFEQTAPRLTVATYFTTKSYAAKNAGVVNRFVRAMNRSLRYAQSHPDEVRRIVRTYTKIPAAAAQRMVLPHWQADLGRPTIEKTAKLAQQYGFTKSPANLDELIRPQQ